MYTISYYGNSAFHVALPDGTGILMDPYLEFGPVGADKLPKTDLVLVTHGADDHIGCAMQVLTATGATLMAPPGVVEYALMCGVRREQCRVMASGADRQFGGVTVKAMPAVHVSFIRLGNGSFITDQPLGYIVTLPDKTTFYHLGDTSIFSDLRLFGELYKPDFAMLPIGMFPGAITELNPEEAALVAKWLGVRMVIPIHYDRKEQADYPDRLQRALCDLQCGVRIHKMDPGDALTVSKADFNA